MMPSSTPQPPLLPVTVTTNSSGAVSGDPPVAAFRQFISRLIDSARQSLSYRRPWSELVDRSALSKPESISDATTRIRKNINYFKVNYAAIIVVVLALSLLTNPFSLIVLFGLFAAWSILYLFRPSDPPLVMFGRQFSERETLLGLTLMTVFVVFMTSVGSILMWALTFGAGIVGAHGAFRQPEDLFLDEQESGAGAGAGAGLLSFFGAAGANAAAAVQAGPALSARV